MPREKSPAFQFYPQDFLADDKVVAMSSAQCGIYIRLLCHCWLSGSIPTDPQLLRRLAQYEGRHWVRQWTVIQDCFSVQAGRLINPRIERERQKQAQYRAHKVAAGIAGGKQKASNSLAKASPPSSSSSSSSSLSLKAAARANGNGHAAAGARSKRPVFTGQRLTVFEWMLDDCMKTLGPLTEAFDLHEWFFLVDQEAMHQGLVIPQRDNGAWLQSQLLREAQRRGLPIAEAEKLKKVSKTAQAVQNILNRKTAE